MKKILFLTCLTLCFSVFTPTNVYSQPGQGQRGGAGRSEMEPPRDTKNYGEPDNLVLEHFPPIPGLSLEQRMDIGIILTKEQGEINKLMQEKRQLEEKEKPSAANKSKKEQEAFQKKMNKIDQKIKQLKDKSNKKIKKILSEEQYRVFIEKRDEFQFRKEPSSMPNRSPNGQSRGDRPERRHQ
jgi:hypothetical protein